MGGAPVGVSVWAGSARQARALRLRNGPAGGIDGHQAALRGAVRTKPRATRENWGHLNRVAPVVRGRTEPATIWSYDLGGYPDTPLPNRGGSAR